ncbi:hypothetical protein CR249_07725 [Ligilactobacillus salivarius]|nr:hypothetical protein CR249_07725 [Ligilactobacillus salivarius]
MINKENHRLMQEFADKYKVDYNDLRYVINNYVLMGTVLVKKVWQK